MAARLYFTLAVLCIVLLCATPTVQHVHKRNDDVSVDTLMTAVSQLTEQVAAMKAQMTAQQNSLTSEGNRIAVLEANLGEQLCLFLRRFIVFILSLARSHR